MLCRISGYTVVEALVNLRCARTSLLEYCPLARAHARAIAVEIRIVMGEEVGVGGIALGRGRRIEHDADDAQEGIVFNDEDRSFGCRHGSYGGCWREGRSGLRQLRLDLKRFRHD